MIWSGDYAPKSGDSDGEGSDQPETMVTRMIMFNERSVVTIIGICALLGVLSTIGIAIMIALATPPPSRLVYSGWSTLAVDRDGWFVSESCAFGRSQTSVSGVGGMWGVPLLHGVPPAQPPGWASKPAELDSWESHVTHSTGLPFRALKGVEIHDRRGTAWRTVRRGTVTTHVFGQSRSVPWLVIWPGFVANTLVYSVLCAGAILGLRWLRRRFLRPAWTCRHCGYDLRNLPSAVCPECGRPARPRPRDPQGA